MSSPQLPPVLQRTAAEWAATDPYLPRYQLCMESDTGKRKVGTGQRWSATSYLPVGVAAPVVSAGLLNNLSTAQQNAIETGSIVTTADGRRWVYSGSGSKTSQASYVALSDVTPTWDSIESKPIIFPAEAHLHNASDITDLAATLAPLRARFARVPQSQTEGNQSGTPVASTYLKLDLPPGDYLLRAVVFMSIEPTGPMSYTNLGLGTTSANSGEVYGSVWYPATVDDYAYYFDTVGQWYGFGVMTAHSATISHQSFSVVHSEVSAIVTVNAGEATREVHVLFGGSNVGQFIYLTEYSFLAAIPLFAP